MTYYYWCHLHFLKGQLAERGAHLTNAINMNYLYTIKLPCYCYFSNNPTESGQENPIFMPHGSDESESLAKIKYILFCCCCCSCYCCCCCFCCFVEVYCMEPEFLVLYGLTMLFC